MSGSSGRVLSAKPVRSSTGLALRNMQRIGGTSFIEVHTDQGLIGLGPTARKMRSQASKNLSSAAILSTSNGLPPNCEQPEEAAGGALPAVEVSPHVAEQAPRSHYGT